MHVWVEDTQDQRGTFVDALCMNDDDDKYKTPKCTR